MDLQFADAYFHKSPPCHPAATGIKWLPRETAGAIYLKFRFGLCVTAAAINRTFLSRLKGNFAFNATPCAGGFEHLPGLAGAAGAGLLPVGPAIRAALGLVLKPFRLIKFLLSNCEYERSAAFSTGKVLVR